MTQASLLACRSYCCAGPDSSKTVVQFQNRPVCPHWLLSIQERPNSVIPFYGYTTDNQCFFLLRVDEKCWNLRTTPLENKGHLTRMYRPSRPRPFVPCYTHTHAHTHTHPWNEHSYIYSDHQNNCYTTAKVIPFSIIRQAATMRLSVFCNVLYLYLCQNHCSHTVL